MTAELYELLAIGIYLLIVGTIGYFSYQRNLSATNFIIGDRSLNFWLTALAAHGSDMSNWLFMAYPSVIYIFGMNQSWAALGLLFFMFLNWQFIAPRVRIATEQYNSLTYSSFFESRLADTSGTIRVVTSIMCLAFYTIYISAGLVGLGLLTEILFEVKYGLGILIGVVILIPYVFFGGYRTLAWIDLFQGLFLMAVIIFVPLYVIWDFGGWSVLIKGVESSDLSLALIPNYKPTTLISILFLFAGWGLGYFGQPHIITKFMGIKRVQDMRKSKYVGMSWMTLALGAATLVGLVGIPFFADIPLENPERVFIKMVKLTFHPFLIGLFLCAVIAATINTMGSQVLVLTSSLTEDLYKRVFRKGASQRELLIVSRSGVVLACALAFGVSVGKVSTIYSLVLYAWSGLGSAFGPLLIFSLYSKNVNKYGAWAGILVGGIISAIWPYFNTLFNLDIPSMIPGFSLSCISIYVTSLLTQPKKLPS